MQAKTYQTEFTRQTRSQIFCANLSWSLQRILFEIRLLFREQKTHISYSTCSSMNLFYQSFRYLLCCYKICLAGWSIRGKIPAEVSTITRQTRVLFSFWGLRILFEIRLLYRGQKTQISYTGTTCCSMILFYQNWQRWAYLPTDIPQYLFKKLKYWIFIYNF